MGRKYLWWVKAAQKRYREKVKESLAAYQKAYYEAHKEERKAYMRAYTKKNRDKYKEYQREYYQREKAKREGLEPIVTDNITFDISFESSLKNIQVMYNSVLQKYNKLLSDYSNLKWCLDQKSKELEQLKNESVKNEEWKDKIKKFFNI